MLSNLDIYRPFKIKTMCRIWKYLLALNINEGAIEDYENDKCVKMGSFQFTTLFVLYSVKYDAMS
jgi:hypothetical protein